MRAAQCTRNAPETLLCAKLPARALFERLEAINTLMAHTLQEITHHPISSCATRTFLHKAHCHTHCQTRSRPPLPLGDTLPTTHTHTCTHTHTHTHKPRSACVYASMHAQPTHRNSGCTVSGLSSSQILSRAGIQEGAKWQFCNGPQARRSAGQQRRTHARHLSRTQGGPAAGRRHG